MAARLRQQGRGKELVLAFGGDVNIGGLIDQSLPQSVPDGRARAAAKRLRQQHPLLQRGLRTAELWGDCAGILGEASITVVSLVSPLTLHSQRSRAAGGGFKPETHRSHPLNVEALVDANIDLVSLANGHSLDFREDGLLDTYEALDAAGIRHMGSGIDRATALRPTVITALGRKLAFFALSAAGGGLRDAAGQEMWAANEQRPGIAHFELWEDEGRAEILSEMAHEVRELRAAQRISLVIVSVCWGAHGPDGRPLAAGGAVPLVIRQFARSLVTEVGVQLVHGHGTGGAMGLEVHEGVPILYSCGALLTDEPAAGAAGPASAASADAGASAAARPDSGYIARLMLRPSDNLGWVELRPVQSRLLQVNQARGRELARALGALEAQCRALGSTCRRSRDGLVVYVTAWPPREPPTPVPAARRLRREAREAAAVLEGVRLEKALHASAHHGAPLTGVRTDGGRRPGQRASTRWQQLGGDVPQRLAAGGDGGAEGRFVAIFRALQGWWTTGRLPWSGGAQVGDSGGGSGRGGGGRGGGSGGGGMAWTRRHVKLHEDPDPNLEEGLEMNSWGGGGWGGGGGVGGGGEGAHAAATLGGEGEGCAPDEGIELARLPRPPRRVRTASLRDETLINANGDAHHGALDEPAAEAATRGGAVVGVATRGGGGGGLSVLGVSSDEDEDLGDDEDEDEDEDGVGHSRAQFGAQLGGRGRCGRSPQRDLARDLANLWSSQNPSPPKHSPLRHTSLRHQAASPPSSSPLAHGSQRRKASPRLSPRSPLSPGAGALGSRRDGPSASPGAAVMGSCWGWTSANPASSEQALLEPHVDDDVDEEDEPLPLDELLQSLRGKR